MQSDAPVFIRGPHGWLEEKGKTRPYLVAALAGALANLGFAPMYFFPATAIGLIALVWLLDGAARRERPMRAAFARAWTFAAAFFLFGLYWLFFSFTNLDGALPLAPVTLLMPAGLALFWGGACALAIRFWSSGPRRIAVFTLAIMVAEFLRGHLFGGFPWNLPGYVWPAGGEISQIASVGGIYGLSALTVLVFAAPATLADAGRLGFRVAPAIVAAVLAGAVWGFGAQRLANSPPPIGPIVRVMDAGFTQKQKWRDGNAVYRAYASLLDGPTESHADIDIWPESALPFRLLDEPDIMANLGARLGDRVLVVGVTRIETQGAAQHSYNSGVVLDGVAGNIRVGQIYNKNKLVPFGEFIPLWSLIGPIATSLHIRALQAMQDIGAGFDAGEPPQRVVIPGAGDAAILICYEAIFPGFAPRGADRPSWLINISNDAWFSWQPDDPDRTPAWLTFVSENILGGGPKQHFNQASYRSIEEGLPLARAASGGISAIVDSYGRVVVSTGVHGGAVEAPLPAALPPTIFAAHNRVISFIVFLVLAGLGIALPTGQATGRIESKR